MNEEDTLIDQFNTTLNYSMDLLNFQIEEIKGFQSFCDTLLEDANMYTLRSVYVDFKKELQYMAQSISDSYGVFFKTYKFKHFKNNFKFIISSMKDFSEILVWNYLIEKHALKGMQMDFDHDIYKILPQSKTDPEFQKEDTLLRHSRDKAIENFNNKYGVKSSQPPKAPPHEETFDQ